MGKCLEACVAGKKPRVIQASTQPAVFNQDVHAVVECMDTVSLQPGLVVGSTCVNVDDIGNIPVQIANFSDGDIYMCPKMTIEKRNGNADAVSRKHQGSIEPIQAESTPITTVTFPSFPKDDMSKWQRADATIGRVWSFWDIGRKPTVRQLMKENKSTRKLLREWKRLVNVDGVLYRIVMINGNRVKQVLLPENLKGQVMDVVHGQMGHQAMKKTLAIVRTRCFWSSMSADVESYCKSCNRCMLSKMGWKLDYSVLEPSRKEAFRFGRSRTEKEAFRRDRLHNSTIGSRVFLRNRGIKRRNKVQDVYGDKPYKVVDGLQDNVYVVEPLQREGPSKTVHRGELLHMGDIARATQRYEESVLSNSEEAVQAEDLISSAVPDVSLQQSPPYYADREPGLHKATGSSYQSTPSANNSGAE